MRNNDWNGILSRKKKKDSCVIVLSSKGKRKNELRRSKRINDWNEENDLFFLVKKEKSVYCEK